MSLRDVQKVQKRKSSHKNVGTSFMMKKNEFLSCDEVALNARSALNCDAVALLGLFSNSSNAARRVPTLLVCEALYTATQSRLNRPKAIERPQGFERCVAALNSDAVALHCGSAA